MKKISIYSLIFHFFIIVTFIYHHSFRLLPMLIAPLLHLIILNNQSHYRFIQANEIQMNQLMRQQRRCEICKIQRWMRMRHCYKCQTCIHKYDHHCVLMGICIGEFNHKYYVIFLFAYMLNSLLLVKTFQAEIKKCVTMDENGIEYLSNCYYAYAICLIALYFNTFLSLFLAFYHTNFMANNQTTWQMAKRDNIPYLKNIDSHIEYPFSRGIFNNLKIFFQTSPKAPIRWQLSS